MYLQDSSASRYVYSFFFNLFYSKIITKHYNIILFPNPSSNFINARNLFFNQLGPHLMNNPPLYYSYPKMTVRVWQRTSSSLKKKGYLGWEPLMDSDEGIWLKILNTLRTRLIKAQVRCNWEVVCRSWTKMRWPTDLSLLLNFTNVFFFLV